MPGPVTIPLKIFILLHFMFTSWALAVDWLPLGYLFCHLMMLIFGIWVVIQPSSHDANQVFLISVLFALLNDCVLIGIYYPASWTSERRFAVTFAFFNLFLKPITMIFITLGYQEHGGSFDYSRVSGAFSSPQGEQEYQGIPEPKPSQTEPSY
ncbi:type-1 angiotensin II receptor-associated protein-like [Dendronephthya gigantea]|uniref:type-1 angiotensin II receptor-associated protein-like n=1 Tax=Dendronephthya gigantea TaxID=151771 RepID=UPI00106AD087|nr:type-1 angiotensin II receptor-associated protein-like [Dendronephthya gigantea]